MSAGDKSRRDIPAPGTAQRGPTGQLLNRPPAFSEPVPAAAVRVFDRTPPVPPGTGMAQARVVSYPILRNNATGVYTTDDSPVVSMTNYDPRILATLGIAFRPDGRDIPTIELSAFPAKTVMNVRADFYVRNQEGQWCAANHIWDYADSVIPESWRLPWTYRWADSPGRVVAKLLQAVATGTGTLPVGEFHAVGIWSLAPGAVVPEPELRRLLAAGTLDVLTGPFVVSQTGAP